MKHTKVDERDALVEDAATCFRVAYVDPDNYVEMHDVECDDIERVVEWAKSYLAASDLKAGTRYFVALRAWQNAETPGVREGVSLTWLTPSPDTQLG